MLDVGSRLQTYFCAEFFRKEKCTIKPKKGAVILVGGGDGRMDKACETACTLLHHMNCREIHPLVGSHNTNKTPAIEDEQAIEGMKSIINFFQMCIRRCSMTKRLFKPKDPGTEEVEAWEKEHRLLLEQIAEETFTITHQVAMLELRKR